jgi:hypothetical protein
MLKYFKLIMTLVTALMSLTSQAQIAEKMRGEHWVEAGGNALVKTFFSPKSVSTKDGIHSLLVKWHYNKEIGNVNSQIAMIRVNCQTEKLATEYVETYSGANLDGTLIAGGQYPTPLQWSGIASAYDAIGELLCKKN